MSERADMDRAKKALRLACAALPHLAGLARVVRLHIDPRIGTAGIFRSGRLLFNPDYLNELSDSDAAFVMAHEMMHLALRTHERGEGATFQLVNIAHDYIINDLLVVEMGQPAPPNVLYEDGMRFVSLERLLARFKEHPEEVPPRCLSRGDRSDSSFRKAMTDAGIVPGSPERWDVTDALTDELEDQWFPGENRRERRECVERIQETVRQAAGLGSLLGHMRGDQDERRSWSVRKTRTIEALHGVYRTPWEAALQRWLDAVAPDPRTYARPSRRTGDRSDVVLAGRRRESWTLHVVVDVSGSMWDQLPKTFGALATFCRGSGIDTIRLIQCDTEIQSDEHVSVDDLARMTVTGFGGAEGEKVPDEPPPPPPPELEKPPEPERRPEPPRVETPPPAPSPWEAPRYQEPVYRPIYEEPAPTPTPSRRSGRTYDPPQGSWTEWIGSPRYHSSYLPPRGTSYSIRWRRRQPRRKTSKPIFSKEKRPPLKKKVEPKRPSLPRASSLRETETTRVIGPDSDLSPALLKLAQEPEVECVIVITDGICAYPERAMPFNVLWIVPDDDTTATFKPAYGSVIAIDSSR